MQILPSNVDWKGAESGKDRFESEVYVKNEENTVLHTLSNSEISIEGKNTTFQSIGSGKKTQCGGGVEYGKKRKDSIVVLMLWLICAHVDAGMAHRKHKR